jgi:Uma2 family endonuclease
MISVQDKIFTEVRPLPIKFTVDDLDFMPDDELKKYEVIGGKLFTVSRAVHINHQLISSRLIIEFGTYLKSNPIGEVMHEPGIVYSKDDAIIPDVVFATHETIKNNVAVKGKYEGKFLGSPDLIVEILSSSKKDIERDRVYKRNLYSEQKVKEFWIVNGLHSTIEVYRLNKIGLELDKVYNLGDEIKTGILPDFALKTADIFRF